jgi:IS30 family transposase
MNNLELRIFIETNLLNGQSPGAISGRIEHYRKDLPNVGKDTIYRFLRSPHGKLIGMMLKTKKRPRGRKKLRKLEDRRFIDQRPKIIENRGRTGDTEGDFIVSGRNGHGILLAVTDRKLRISYLEIIHHISIDEVHQASLRIQKRFPEMKTLTLDNDILFRMHKTLEGLLRIKIYFCHPYHSWEKGSIENLNRYIRKYIPKGSDLSRYDNEYIKWLEIKCNERYMKCLKYATPEEKLKKYRERKVRYKKTA